MKDQIFFEKSLLTQENITLVGPLYDGSNKFQASGPLIFIDGGANFLTLFPEIQEESLSISLGDGDSSSNELDIKLNPEKNFSDFSFALSLIPQNIKNIHLLGLLGGRRDHELANLGEINQFLKKRKYQTKIFFDDQIIAINKGTFHFEMKGTFSLLVLEKTRLKIEGACQYRNKEFMEFLPLTSLGLSNIGSGIVEIDGEGPYFIFLNDKPTT